MRISDWSSDVCSSDLLSAPYFSFAPDKRCGVLVVRGSERVDGGDEVLGALEARVVERFSLEDAKPDLNLVEPAGARSEEHTSELQSLMRISYAVFCLKKKNTKKNNTVSPHANNSLTESKFSATII